jgi:hypothetical protein
VGEGGVSLSLGGPGVSGAEEDIVVDSLVEVCSSADFVLESGQPLGLDLAVLQSVERCSKCIFVIIAFSLSLSYIGKPILDYGL